MRAKLPATAFLLALVVAGLASAQGIHQGVAGVSVRLEAVPTKTLPFLPVSFELEIRNDGAAVAFLPNHFFVGIVDGGRARYFDSSHGLPGFDGAIVLRPGESLRATLLSAAMEPRIVPLHPPELSKAGTYAVRVASGGPEGSATFVLTSSDADVTVEDPSEEDAGALELVRAAMGERFTGRRWNRVPPDVRAEVRRRFPASVYNQALLPVSWGMAVEEIRDAIAVAPHAPMATGLRVLEARVLEQQAWRAAEEGDAAGAAHAAHLAAEAIADARRLTTDAFALRALDEVGAKLVRSR